MSLQVKLPKRVFPDDDPSSAMGPFKGPDPSTPIWIANIDPGGAKVAPLTSGYISLQGESSPVEFRNVELKILDR